MLSVITSIFAIAPISLLLKDNKNKIFWGYILMSALTICFLYISWLNHTTEYDNYSFVWLKNITINIGFNNNIFKAILPSFIAAIGIGFYNLKQNKESTLTKNAILIFNIIALLFLASAANIIQTMISLMVIDLIALMSLQKEEKTRLMYYSFLSNSLLFFAFAALFIKEDSIILSQIVFPKELSLINIIILLSIAIRSALLGFNNYISKAPELKNSRLIALLYTSTPISGMILAHKLVFLQNDIFIAYAIITMLVYITYFLIQSNMQQKIISFAIANFALSIYLNNCQTILASSLISFIMLISINAASYEDNIKLLGQFIKKTKVFYLASTISIFFYFNCLAKLPQNSAVIIFEVISIIGIATTMHEIFIKKFAGFDEVYDNIKKPSLLYYIPLLLSTAFLAQTISLYGAYMFAAYFIAHLMPLKNIIRTAPKSVCKPTYFPENVIIAPLKVLGRSLWLTIDFLLIKKSIIRPSLFINKWIIDNYKKIEKKEYLWIAMGFVILAIIGASNL